MPHQYGDENYRELYIPDQPGFYPRHTRYGEDEAWAAGLTPIEYADGVDVIDWLDLKEVLQKAHDDRIMPMYHQFDTWAGEDFRYSQSRTNYCWTWSGTAAVMDCRAAEHKDTVKLAPVSMGYLVGWRNRGNYLESFIRGAREQGIAPIDFVDGNINSINRNPGTYKEGWKEERKKYRLNEIWDTNTRNGDRTAILHCATILAAGRPIYLAYNWWGHALNGSGLRWDESKKNNVVWQIRNSHNEPGLIELDGSRGVPDEAYGFVSTRLAA